MNFEILKTMKNHKKQIIIVLISLIIIFIIGSRLWDFFITQKVISLYPTPGTTITVGTQVGEGANIGTIIAKASTKQSLRLEPGYYAVTYSGTKDYISKTIVINLDKSLELKTPILNMTQGKLNQLLLAEKTSAQNVLSLIFNTNGYSIVDEKLYQQGDWYGARLVYNDGSRNTLRIILKKENGQWKLMAGPSIIISIDDYPEIPKDIVRATNKLGFW